MPISAWLEMNTGMPAKAQMAKAAAAGDSSRDSSSQSRPASTAVQTKKVKTRAVFSSRSCGTVFWYRKRSP